jgi:hypothetical protein
MKPLVNLMQERDFGLKINAVSEFLIQNLKPLMTCILYIAGPVAIVAGIAGGVYQSGMLSEAGDILKNIGRQSGLSNQFTPVYFVYLGFLMLTSVVTSLVVYGYVLEYEARGGNKPTITPQDVWPTVRDNFFTNIGVTLFMMVVIVIGCVLFIIPGLYLATVFSLIIFVMLRENLSMTPAMSRCFYLIKDKWWSTFGLILVTALIQAVVGLIFQAPQTAFTLLKMFGIIKIDGSIIGTITTVVATLGNTLTSSIVILAIIFQYYNLVERRDGSGMLQAIQAIGTDEKPRIERSEDEQY